MLIEHISVSRCQTYETCAAQYKFRYHDKIILNEPEAIYFTLGKMAHKIIELHSKSKGTEDIQKLMHKVLTGEISCGSTYPSAMTTETIARLRQHVTNYLKLVDKIGYDGEVEWRFNVDLQPPNKKILVGILDRLIVKNNQIRIIDYKTTKPHSLFRKDGLKILQDLQLACYCWIVREHFQVSADNIGAALYYLEDGKLVSARFSDKTLDYIAKKLLSVYEEIEIYNADKVIGRVGNHCQYCDYKKICPFVKLV